jgi:uncharacterized protein YbjT (DUF2867 family)
MTFTLSHTPLRIFFTGATGYIGGSVLQQLLAHPRASTFEITSYSRNAERAQKLEREFGVKYILGELDDVQKIEDAAAVADVVFHFANSADHIPSAQAILRGLKRKHAESGQVPIYIHTVGFNVALPTPSHPYGSPTVWNRGARRRLEGHLQRARHQIR